MTKHIVPFKLCIIEGCLKKYAAKGLCSKHYQRNRVHGRLHRIIKKRGGGSIANGYHQLRVNNKNVLAHRLIAEKALGRSLPDGAEVHHIDGNGLNNTNSNLVICPTRAYHRLLHQRQKAYEACGHADWRKCTYCKKYDSPENIKYYRHQSCLSAYQKNRHIKK